MEPKLLSPEAELTKSCESQRIILSFEVIKSFTSSLSAATDGKDSLVSLYLFCSSVERESRIALRM